MQVKIYANYGVLAHEYQTIYTYGVEHCHAVTSDIVTVDIPDDLISGENYTGDPLLKLPGTKFLWPLSEALSHYGNKPCLRWFDGYENHRIMLKICD